MLTEEQKFEIQQEVESRVRALLSADPISREYLQSAGPQSPHWKPLVQVIARAVEVLGTSEKALRWINTPVRALGDKTPASLLTSPEGIASVEDALGRVEHGVW